MKLDWLATELRVKQGVLEHAINGTPSGERRNLMTESNIHLTLALDKLEKASQTMYPVARLQAGDNVADKGASSHGY